MRAGRCTPGLSEPMDGAPPMTTTPLPTETPAPTPTPNATKIAIHDLGYLEINRFVGRDDAQGATGRMSSHQRSR